MDKSAQNEHPIHEVLAQRWSPRAFADRPVEAATLRRLLEAARWAPSCFNEQPWRFLVALKGDAEAHKKMLGCLLGTNQDWARKAPILLLTFASMRFKHDGKENAHAWHDLGLAMGNLSAEATHLGLGLHQMAAIDRNGIRAAYEIPDGVEPVTAVALGYPGDPTSLPNELHRREVATRERRPQSEWVFGGQWGASFEG